jgi:hypothetical protein
MWEGPVRKATRVQSQRKINQRTILTFTNTIKKNYEGELVNTTRRRLIGCCTSSIYATLFSFA